MIIPNNGKNSGIALILDLLPTAVSEGVRRVTEALPGGAASVRELRLRAGGITSLVTESGCRRISSAVSYDDVSEVLARLTGGSLYAHRDTIAEGYISIGNGMRVGISGRARYEGGSLVGVSEVRSLVFRFSHGRCDVEEELFGVWKRGIGSGLLIYSPPMGGKTTAIRRLSARIGESGVRVAVVDERCEFLPDDYRLAEVELLRGYDKARGIEIAVRTLGAQLVVVDEIGAREASSIMSLMTLGVPLISTVHAASMREIRTRPAFAPIIGSGVFETFAGIVLSGGRRRLECTYRPLAERESEMGAV